MMRVNVFAKNLGWLFEDLKAGFARLDVPGVSISVAEDADADADAWIAIRAAEVASAPDLGRTVACMHDLYDDPELYARDGVRGGLHGARGLVLCHPDQRRLLRDAGVSLDDKVILERPLGPLSIFTPRRSMPATFTIGWVGRNDHRKRLDWTAAVASELDIDPAAFCFLLLGRDLEPAAARLRDNGVACELLDRDDCPIAAYPALYERMDCLLITSRTEAGPLTLFEALATGLPVVSTPVGWAPHFQARNGAYVMTGATPAELARHLEDVSRRRESLFAERASIAALAARWKLDDWFADVVEVARGVVGGR